jgi:V8-like Glu-specific endopeptidase
MTSRLFCPLPRLANLTLTVAIGVGALSDIRASNAQAQSLRSPVDHARAAIDKALENLTRADSPTASAVESVRTALRDGTPPRVKRVVNGTEEIAYPTAGALLKGSDPKSAGGWCSGTLIGCQTFLTAAHCIVGDADPHNYLVYFQHAGIYGVEEIQWQKDQYDMPNADVAVLRLTRQVDGIPPLSINRLGTPPYGATGIIVGYGRTGGSHTDYGIKRIGSIKTAACDQSQVAPFAANLVCWKYDALVNRPGQDSNTCHGDSGGGLHVGTENVVAGVTSGGLRDDCLAGDQSYDANVFQYRTWIDASARDQTAGTCGALGALDRDWTIKGDTQRLDEGNPQVQYALDVPTGTARLRVAMNAEENGESDFDLYVLQGDIDDVKQAVCTEDGPGQFAFCEITHPTTGRWTIVVKRKRGSGLVQTVATLIPEMSKK